MELAILLLGLLVATGSLCGLIAAFRVTALSSTIARLEAQVAELSRPSPAPAPPAPVREPVAAPALAPAPLLELKPALVREPAVAASPDRSFDPEPAPDDPWDALETLIGRRWITWVGALALFVAAGLFLKLAMDRNWLPPTTRVLLATGFGLTLLLLGHRSAGKRALSHGLFGAGLATLYVTLFAGLSLYHLYPRELAFAAMLAVTVTGALLAIRHDALPIAVLSTLGGLITPVLVSSGDGSRDALCTYLVILDLGVLAVAYFRRWRVLEALALVGTWVLFVGWYASHDRDAVAELAPTMAWLVALFAIFAALPFVYSLRRGLPIGADRFAAALGNAAVMLGVSAHLLTDHRHLLGLVSLGMAAVYLALGHLTRRRLPDDGRAIFGFVVLSMFFATLAIPLHLRAHGVTLAWALEGPVLLYLGHRYRYFPVRAAGLLVIVLATLHLLARDQLGLAGMCVPLAGASYALLLGRLRSLGDERDTTLQLIAALGAAVLTLVLIHRELPGPWAPVLVWTLGSVALYAHGHPAARFVSVFTTGFAALLAVIGYGTLDDAVHPLFLHGRFVAALAVIAALFARRRQPLATAAAIAGLWLLLTVETGAQISHKALGFTWGAYAIGLLAIGMARDLRPLRLAALALFGLTAGKLVFVDLASVEQLYRVLSFLVIGVLMIVASYLYHRRSPASRVTNPARCNEPQRTRST